MLAEIPHRAWTVHSTPEYDSNSESLPVRLDHLIQDLMDMCALVGLDPGEIIRMKNIRNALKHDSYHCNNGFTPEEAIRIISMKWNIHGGDKGFSLEYENYVKQMVDSSFQEPEIGDIKDSRKRATAAKELLLHEINNTRRGDEVRDLFRRLASHQGLAARMDDEALELEQEIEMQTLEGQVFPIASEIADVLIFAIKCCDQNQLNTEKLMVAALKRSLKKPYEQLDDAETLGGRIKAATAAIVKMANQLSYAETY